MELNVLFVLDAIGAIAFALSGSLAAIKNKMDWFGVFVLACVTTFGGGTLRDLILGVPPIAFYESQHYVLICILASLAVLIFAHHIEKQSKIIMLCDSVGLALFTVSGTLRALDAGAPWLSAIILALITACGGGMLRDILRNEKPYVLYRDFYASAALLGSSLLVLFILKLDFSVKYSSIFCALIIFCIRLAILLTKWGNDKKISSQQRYTHIE